jgi:hypothetical protein
MQLARLEECISSHAEAAPFVSGWPGISTAGLGRHRDTQLEAKDADAVRRACQ